MEDTDDLEEQHYWYTCWLEHWNSTYSEWNANGWELTEIEDLRPPHLED